MKLPDFEAWAIFAAVVEHRSFSGAADAIGMSKATVSKAVARLEAHLNQSLFHRTSRRLTLTESGKALAEHAQRIVAEAVAAEEAASDSGTALSGAHGAGRASDPWPSRSPTRSAPHRSLGSSPPSTPCW